jgi:hypothetical protein
MERRKVRYVFAILLLIASIVLLFLSYRPIPIQHHKVPMPSIEVPWVE